MTMFFTVLGASLLGNLHCVGMCGPLMVFAAGDDGHFSTQSVYHGGRLAAYIILGLIAGLLGEVVNTGGTVIGISGLTALLSAAFLAGWGTLTIVRHVRGRRSSPHTKRFRIFQRASALLSRVPWSIRPFAFGIGSALLPCGWLYAFVAAASGSGSPALGAVTMVAFWIGTLPGLVALGAGARTLVGPLRRYAPVISAVTLVVMGLFTVATRLYRIEHIHHGTALQSHANQVSEHTPMSGPETAKETCH